MNSMQRRYRPKLEDPAYMEEEDDELKNPYIISHNPLNGSTSFQSESGYKLTMTILVPFVFIGILIIILKGGPWLLGLPYFAVISVLAFYAHRIGRARAERYKQEKKR